VAMGLVFSEPAGGRDPEKANPLDMLTALDRADWRSLIPSN